MKILIQALATTALLVMPLLLTNWEVLCRFMEKWWTSQPLLFLIVFFAPGITLVLRNVWKNRKGQSIKSHGH